MRQHPKGVRRSEPSSGRTRLAQIHGAGDAGAAVGVCAHPDGGDHLRTAVLSAGSSCARLAGGHATGKAPTLPGCREQERHLPLGQQRFGTRSCARRMQRSRRGQPAGPPTAKGYSVELAGTTSWRFEESARDDLLHVALFVRDAVGIPVVPGPAVPPRLVGTVPDNRGLLREDERQEAGRQWDGWWMAVLSLEDRSQKTSRCRHPAGVTGAAGGGRLPAGLRRPRRPACVAPRRRRDLASSAPLGRPTTTGLSR